MLFFILENVLVILKSVLIRLPSLFLFFTNFTEPIHVSLLTHRRLMDLNCWYRLLSNMLWFRRLICIEIKLRIPVLFCFVASFDCILQEISFLKSFRIPSSNSNEWIGETIRLVVVVDDPHFLNTAYFSTTGVKCQLTVTHRINFTLVYKNLFLRINLFAWLLPLTHYGLVHRCNVIVVWVPNCQILFQRINLTIWS